MKEEWTYRHKGFLRWFTPRYKMVLHNGAYLIFERKWYSPFQNCIDTGTFTDPWEAINWIDARIERDR